MTPLTHDLIRTGALQFGSFQTKSGRTSPYFVNTSLLYESLVIQKIAKQCAMILEDNKVVDADFFGPAYKGIALATAVCMQVADKMPHSKFAFFRKEKKLHGEGGQMVGSLRGNAPLVIIEDVLTGGTALRQTHAELKSANIQNKVACVLVVLDRQEKGQGILAKKEIEALYGCPCIALTNIEELISELETWNELPDGYDNAAINSYRAEFCS